VPLLQPDSPSPARGATRLVRSAVLGTACLLLALSAHVLAGGQAPSVLALLVLSVPIGCACVLVTGRQVGLLRIGTVLGVTQVVLHEAFLSLAQSACAPAGTSIHAHGQSMAAACGTATAGPMHMAAPTWSMLAAHALAAAAVGLLLRQGERLLWAVVSWLAPAPPLHSALLLPAAGLRPGAPAVRRSARSVAIPGGVGLRGPPAGRLA
jgi:hypothetical protein